jgi:hypothetical protein
VELQTLLLETFTFCTASNANSNARPHKKSEELEQKEVDEASSLEQNFNPSYDASAHYSQALSLAWVTDIIAEAKGRLAHEKLRAPLYAIYLKRLVELVHSCPRPHTHTHTYTYTYTYTYTNINKHKSAHA